MSVDLFVSHVVPCEWHVLFRAGTGPLPDDDTLRGAVVRWIRERAPAPLRDAILAWLDHVPAGIAVSDLDPSVVPPRSVLVANGLGAEEDAMLRGATHALRVDTISTPEAPYPGIWLGIAAARALASLVDGVVLDPDTGTVCPLDERNEPLPSEHLGTAAHHVKAVASQDGDALWVTTAGMRRLGLPNLEIRDVPAPLLQPASLLLLAAAERLNDATRAHVASHSERPLHLEYLRLPSTVPWRRSLRLHVRPTQRPGMDLVEVHSPRLRDPGLWIEDVGRRLFGSWAALDPSLASAAAPA